MELFHRNDYSEKASLGQHNKSNTKTKSKTSWGSGNDPLAAIAPVCPKISLTSPTSS
jgi:hypothetical protein